MGGFISDVIASIAVRLLSVLLLLIATAVVGFALVFLTGINIGLNAVIPLSEQAIPYIGVADGDRLVYSSGVIQLPRQILLMLVTILYIVLVLRVPGRIRVGGIVAAVQDTLLDGIAVLIHLAVLFLMGNIFIAAANGLLRPAMVLGMEFNDVFEGVFASVTTLISLVITMAMSFSINQDVVFMAAVDTIFYLLGVAQIGALLILVRVAMVIVPATVVFTIILTMFSTFWSEESISAMLSTRVGGLIRLSLQIIIAVFVGLSIAGALYGRLAIQNVLSLYSLAEAMKAGNYPLVSGTVDHVLRILGEFINNYNAAFGANVQAPPACSLDGRGTPTCISLLSAGALYGVIFYAVMLASMLISAAVVATDEKMGSTLRRAQSFVSQAHERMARRIRPAYQRAHALADGGDEV